jgi:hypothetical protein
MIKYETSSGIDVKILNFFHKKVALITIIKVILLITKLHFKGLKRNIKNMCAKKRYYLMFLNKFWNSIK